MHAHTLTHARTHAHTHTHTQFAIHRTIFVTENVYRRKQVGQQEDIVQELCESRGGRPGLSVLTSLPVSVDVKLY